jgi:hypothetical protein
MKKESDDDVDLRKQQRRQEEARIHPTPATSEKRRTGNKWDDDEERIGVLVRGGSKR